MRYKYLVLALVPVLSLLLTACTLKDLPVIGKFLGSQESSEPVNLMFWGMWEPSSVYEPVIKAYKEKKPNISVTYENRDTGGDLFDYKERVYQRSKSESIPDIIMVHNSWIPRMVNLGLLAPMPSDKSKDFVYKDNFYPAAEESGVVNNQIYGLPAYHDSLVLVYNKSHFKEINQTTPPSKWEEFRVLALKLTIRGEDQNLIRAGAAIGSADNIDNFGDILGLVWSQAGVKIPDGIDATPAVDALSFYTDFVKEDQVWSNEMPEAVTAFVRGQASMIFVPSWQVLRILNEMENDSDVGVAPVPQALDTGQRNWASFWMYAVPANAANPAAAWDFVTHLASPEQEKVLYSEQIKIRTFGSPYAHKSLKENLSSNPFIDPVLRSAENAKSAEIAGRSGNKNQTNILKEAVNSVLLGVADSKEALAKAKQSFTKL